MKRFGMIALIAILIATMAVSAQEPVGRPDRPMRGNRPGKEMKMKLAPKERAENMQKKLELSDEETQKLQALFEKEDAQMKEMQEKRQQEMKQKKEKGQEKFQQVMEQHQKEGEIKLLSGKPFKKKDLKK